MREKKFFFSFLKAAFHQKESRPLMARFCFRIHVADVNSITGGGGGVTATCTNS